MAAPNAPRLRGPSANTNAAVGQAGLLVAGMITVWIGLCLVRAVLLAEANAPALVFWTLLAEAIAPAVVAAMVVWILARQPKAADEARLIASRGALIHTLEGAREALLAIQGASERQVEAAMRMARIAHAVEREGDRLESLFSGVREDAPALIEDARAIGAAWDRVRDQALRQSDALRAALRDVREGGARVSAEIGVALARQTQQIEAIDAASRTTTAAIASRAYALDAAVEGALGRSEVVLTELTEQGQKLVQNSRRDHDVATARAETVLSTARQVVGAAQYLDADSPAREEAIYAARRFTKAFEALLAALTPGGSEALIRILLASDFGRLYLRLGARLGRFPTQA